MNDAEAVIDAEAVMWSASGPERAGRPLLVLLHGYGSHEGDLFGLAPQLPLDPVIASIRAPLSIGYGGHAWFPLRDVPGEPDLKRVDAAAEAVLSWLDAHASEFDSIGLLGFSQGGALALQLMRHAPERFAYAVMLSGFVAGESHPGDARLAAQRPNVFWGRGTADPVIPDSAIARTHRWLPEHAALTEGIYEGMAHSVSASELTDINQFLRAQFGATNSGSGKKD